MELHKTAIKLSIVVSVYNEEQTIELFYNELKKVLNEMVINHEIVFVNDGSVDNSLSIMRNIASKDSNVRIINFSRNFGHEAAMLAGIERSKGNAIICMDADLQHPPNQILEMVEKFSNGYDIVIMKRLDNESAGFFRKLFTKSFYFLINKISPIKLEPNATDFFLISREVAKVITNEFHERTIFLRGLLQNIGFNKVTIEFTAPKRFAGKSKYSIFKLFALSFLAISSLSKIPLYTGIFLGVITSIFGLIVTFYSVIMKILGHTPPGYTTLVVLESFLFSIAFLLIGIVGYYIGIILTEVKNRPIYIVKEEIEQNKDKGL